MSSGTEAIRTDNSSLQGGKGAADEKRGEIRTDRDKTPTTGSSKDPATASGNQGSGVADTSGGSTSSGEGASAKTELKDAQPDDGHKKETEDDDEGEEDSDEEVPQFQWGNPRGRLAPPVKGQQPRPK